MVRFNETVLCNPPVRACSRQSPQQICTEKQQKVVQQQSRRECGWGTFQTSGRTAAPPSGTPRQASLRSSPMFTTFFDSCKPHKPPTTHDQKMEIPNTPQFVLHREIPIPSSKPKPPLPSSPPTHRELEVGEQVRPERGPTPDLPILLLLLLLPPRLAPRPPRRPHRLLVRRGRDGRRRLGRRRRGRGEVGAVGVGGNGRRRRRRGRRRGRPERAVEPLRHRPRGLLPHREKRLEGYRRGGEGRLASDATAARAAAAAS